MCTGIRAEEEKLFDEWKKERDYKVFIRDGVVDPDTWALQKRKVLLILKEVNSTDGKEWDLRGFLQYGAKHGDNPVHITWDVVRLWLVGLQHLEENLPWEEILRLSQGKEFDYLKTAAVMNIKKSAGTSRSYHKEIEQYAIKDKVWLERQVMLYKPDIIVTGGTYYYLKHFLAPHIEATGQPATNKTLYKNFLNGKTLIFQASHPAARKSHQKMYSSLIDAVREVMGVG